MSLTCPRAIPGDYTRWPPTAAPRPRGERQHTYLGLAAALRGAHHVPGFQPSTDRYVIFSDLHKGTREKHVDDFQHNEPLYCRALRYYLDRRYRLVLNGDIEEGWKADIRTILEAYRPTVLALEREFVRQGEDCYLRIYGNHDQAWANPQAVDRLLRPALGPIQVHPAVVLGSRILIVHGHQGDRYSDRHSRLSQRVVRYLWRPLQRWTALRVHATHSVATTCRPRDRHLAGWAREHRFLLIAGHTHRPFFPTEGSALPYLNGGSCVHRDGITGIEIDQGVIRLVQWSGLEGGASEAASRSPSNGFRRTVVHSAELAALLGAL